jgi:hypothetical protein
MITKGIESKLLDNKNFNEWCETVGLDILNEKYLDKTNIGFKLKTHIINNEMLFYTSLKNQLEKEVLRLKKQAKELFNKDVYNYKKTGHRLSIVNDRLKEYNIEQNKAYQRNQYNLFKRFLKDKGLEDLHRGFLGLRVDG